MKRKIYDRLLTWKNGAKGDSALMIEGVRRVGKSYIVEEFAKAICSKCNDFSLINFDLLFF